MIRRYLARRKMRWAVRRLRFQTPGEKRYLRGTNRCERRMIIFYKGPWRVYKND